MAAACISLKETRVEVALGAEVIEFISLRALNFRPECWTPILSGVLSYIEDDRCNPHHSVFPDWREKVPERDATHLSVSL